MRAEVRHRIEALTSLGIKICVVTWETRVTEPPAVKALLALAPRLRRPCAFVLAKTVGVTVKAALSTVHLHTVCLSSKDVVSHFTAVDRVAVDGTTLVHVGVTLMNGHCFNSTSRFLTLVWLHVNGTVWPLLHVTDVDPMTSHFTDTVSYFVS